MIRRILNALFDWPPDPGMPWPEGIVPVNTHADPYVRVCETIRRNRVDEARWQMRGGAGELQKDQT